MVFGRWKRARHKLLTDIQVSIFRRFWLLTAKCGDCAIKRGGNLLINKLNSDGGGWKLFCGEQMSIFIIESSVAKE